MASSDHGAAAGENGDGIDPGVGAAILTEIRRRAKSANQTVVLAEPHDDRVLRAADWIGKDGMAQIILLGPEGKLSARAKDLGLAIDRAMVIDPATSGLKEIFARNYYERRKHKGLTQEQARKAVENPLYFGASMVQAGICDGMVAGSVSPTSKVIQAGIHCVGLAKGLKTVSSFFLVVTPRTEFGCHGSFIYADAGVVPDPTPEQLADIAVASAQHCELLLQTEPRLAFLSFSTYGSAKHPMIDKVTSGLAIFRSRKTGYKADGELQLDAAIVPSVASHKAKGSEVAGRANVLIFPDLNAGNIGYKLTERFAQGRAVGPILQGLDMPVNDLSRGCKWQDIVDAVAITALQAVLAKGRTSRWTGSPSAEQVDQGLEAAGAMG